MRLSRLFLRTLRDDPADAELDSHKLLVRAGYIRRVAAGVYSWLPLGHRVLRRIEGIVRDEMDAAGAQELLLPQLQPLELWRRSGRDEVYGPLMFRLHDRKEATFCLAPTAEEVITTIVAAEYSSYRDLPVNLYQIGWKYRDELRPRFGLLRGREFLMKDAYSFDADIDGLRTSYRAMFDAYHRIFERCGLTFRPVEAQAGQIGGDVNHEFMAVAAVGEDEFVWCRACTYAANVEAATRQSGDADADVAAGADASEQRPPMEVVSTPGLPGIHGVAEHLGVTPSEMLKCIVFAFTVDGADDGSIGLALVPGDREVNEHLLARALAPAGARLLDDADFAARPDLARGYIGPHQPGVAHVVADPAVASGPDWVTGANAIDHHVRHAVLGRDFTVHQWAPLATVATGDPCPRCGQALSVDRGIELGHTFQLGARYSEAFEARFTDPAGAQHPMLMGCYGIGVSRLVAAIAEEHHDELGLRWPAAVAPYDVHLVALPGRGQGAGAGVGVMEAAERLYRELTTVGLAVLFDDRDATAGVKFADADLLGVPVQLVIGAKGVARGVVERKVRGTGSRDDLPLDGAVALVSGSTARAPGP